MTPSIRTAFVALVAAFSASTLFGQTKPQAIAIVTTNAPIFSEAKLTATVMRVAEPGTVLNVMKQEAEWVQVEFNDSQAGARNGWVQASSLNLIMQGLEPMDLSVRKSSAPAAAQPATTPRPPCLIIKTYQKKGADAWTRWTVPKPFNYVEGEFPKGINFRNELDDKHVREINARGGHVVVLKSDYALPDLQDAREQCRTWQETAK